MWLGRNNRLEFVFDEGPKCMKCLCLRWSRRQLPLSMPSLNDPTPGGQKQEVGGRERSADSYGRNAEINTRCGKRERERRLAQIHTAVHKRLSHSCCYKLKCASIFNVRGVTQYLSLFLLNFSYLHHSP